MVAYPDGFQLDHINPVHKAGEDLDDKAVQVLCPPCHEKKTCSDMGIRYRVQINADGWPEE